MKNKFKGIISILLSVVLLCSFAQTAFSESEASTNDFAVGDIVTCGSYPQSMVEDKALLTELNSLDLDWVSYGFYSGNNKYGEMVPSDYIKYADVSYNGDEYRAVYMTKYRPSTPMQPFFEDDNSDNYRYDLNTVYWFKYEPIQWKVLNPETGLVVSNIILDSQNFSNMTYRGDGYDVYNDKKLSHYINDYATSSIRYWLNEEFYNTAFSGLDKYKMYLTDLDNSAYDDNHSQYNSESTTDKLFLLSYDDVTNSNYGFYSKQNRIISCSDYAEILSYGSQNSSDNSLGFHLRSAGDDSFSNAIVSRYGEISTFANAAYVEGVLPAMTLELNGETKKVTTKSSSVLYKWTLYKDGELVINDSILSASPWQDFRELVKYITIEDGAIIMDYRTLSYCVAKNIILPESMREIRSASMADCSRLTEIKIPASVTLIDNHAFMNCDKLTKITILNPKCEIGILGANNSNLCIYGYKNSTAKEYAEKNNIEFVELLCPEHKYICTTQNPTCTENGSKTYTCKVCNDTYSEIIPSTNHANKFAVSGKSATCTEDGYTDYVYCPDCQSSFDKTIIPAGHQIVIDKAVDATCTTDGKTQGSHCSVCNTVLEEQQIVSATGHTESDWIIDKDSTCTEPGSKHTVCSVCGITMSAQDIEATGHDYVTYVTYPTCSSDGYTSHICSVCGNNYQDNFVEQIGHHDDNNDGLCDDCEKVMEGHNPSENCTCMCHKTGFMQFIYKIVRIFWILFGTNKTCNCGVAHY